jgi:hypothetical protein
MILVKETRGLFWRTIMGCIKRKLNKNNSFVVFLGGEAAQKHHR